MFFAVGPNKATFTACRHNCKTIDLHWGALKKKAKKERAKKNREEINESKV